MVNQVIKSQKTHNIVDWTIEINSAEFLWKASSLHIIDILAPITLPFVNPGKRRSNIHQQGVTCKHDKVLWQQH